ncbi:MAG: HEAT repeat domain-containing protein [Planctomycetes bacterium]|nr:HEAT repeat domain-containing protein [Planctomycetota bacterium]
MILPLVEAGNEEAFVAWVRRDPSAALEFARKSAKLPASLAPRVAELLWQKGGIEDVALGLRLESMLREPGLAAQQVLEFLKRVGAGTLGVIQLAALPMPRGANFTMRLEAARAAAAGAKVADLEELLHCMPTLQVDSAMKLRAVLERQIRPEHAGLLIAAIEARLASPMPMVSDGNSQTSGDGPILRWLVEQLGTTRDPKALPALRKVLGMPDPQSYVLVQAANATLQCAGSSRRQMLVDMLSSSQVEVATAALAAEELRSDAELRDAARTALLRIGDRIEDAQSTFAVLDEADRVGLASAVVKAPNFARFSQQLAMVAIDVLGAQKSAAQVEPIWAGYRHPDEFVRQHAAIALGSTFSREAAPHLIEMLKDDSSDVRTAAQKALDEIANYLDAKAKWEARLK